MYLYAKSKYHHCCKSGYQKVVTVQAKDHKKISVKKRQTNACQVEKTTTGINDFERTDSHSW